MHDLQKRLARVVSAAALATTALTAPALADFVGVSRCNAAGGTSEPVLHFVDGGRRFTVAIGQNGLTRNIIMNERRALAWAAASGLFPEGTTFGNYDDHVCGISAEDAPEPAPEPEPESEPELQQPPGDLEICTFCEAL